MSSKQLHATTILPHLGELPGGVQIKYHFFLALSTSSKQRIKSSAKHVLLEDIHSVNDPFPKQLV